MSQRDQNGEKEMRNGERVKSNKKEREREREKRGGVEKKR